MIKPTELRIGNIIQTYSNTEPITVKSIDHDNNGFVGYYIGYEYGMVAIEIDEEFPVLEGVPITGEWLIKLGLEYKPGGAYDLGHSYSIKYMPVLVEHTFSVEIIDYNTAVWLEGNNAHVLIHYVHQLQNLYFALSGKELITTNGK